MSETEILKDIKDLHDLLVPFAGGHAFNFRSRKSDEILSQSLWDFQLTLRVSVNHEDKSGM